MLDVRFANALETIGVNQFDDALEVGPNVDRHSIERGLYVLIKKLHDPGQKKSIPFLQYRGGKIYSVYIVFELSRFGAGGLVSF